MSDVKHQGRLATSQCKYSHSQFILSANSIFRFSSRISSFRSLSVMLSRLSHSCWNCFGVQKLFVSSDRRRRNRRFCSVSNSPPSEHRREEVDESFSSVDLRVLYESPGSASSFASPPESSSSSSSPPPPSSSSSSLSVAVSLPAAPVSVGSVAGAGPSSSATAMTVRWLQHSLLVSAVSVTVSSSSSSVGSRSMAVGVSSCMERSGCDGPALAIRILVDHSYLNRDRKFGLARVRTVFKPGFFSQTV
uniref:Uncharacterized protein n=1 Tax=Anopheles farauti TaxID=69004 RepID=A0A182PZZ3_9DIPT